MTTPSDNDCDNQYTRAAAQLAEWKKSGILVRDDRPSLTFVEETFTGPDGKQRVRHGFLAALRLHQLDEGVVFAHEHTMSGPKEDRYHLMSATAMSLSPVFLLYDLPGDEVTAAWKNATGAEPAPRDRLRRRRQSHEAVAHLRSRPAGGCGANSFRLSFRHRRRPSPVRDGPSLSDGPRHSRRGLRACVLQQHVRPRPGHLRHPPSAAGLPPERLAALPGSLAGTFVVDRLGESGRGEGRGAAAQAAITRYLAEHPRWAFGLWGPDLDAVYGLRLSDAEAAHAAAPGHSAAYQELDVSILQSLVLEKVLGISAADMAAERYVTFFKDPNDAFSRLERGEFQVGFFMNPTGLDQIREVAFGGERMPQKATFFYPKLPTGVVLYDLTDR